MLRIYRFNIKSGVGPFARPTFGPVMNEQPAPRLDTSLLDLYIRNNLAEDIGPGDFTSMATIPANKLGSARLLVKDHGVLCGLPVAKAAFEHLDPQCSFEEIIEEGTDIDPGLVAFRIHGRIRSILAAERLVLNTMQRLSGVAHISRVFAKAVEGTRAKILDTRKTTPGMRFLEKYAVAIGGAQNYRSGLYDWIMIKDNHVDGAGGMDKAIEGVKKFLRDKNLHLDITVEVRNLKELEIVLQHGGVRRIMLDNFELDSMEQAVRMVNDTHEVEASGGVTLDSVRAIAETGVDYISVGALTHSARSIDLSLKIVKE